MSREQSTKFTHRNTIQKVNGEIAAYEIEIHDMPSGETVILQVKPGHLISHISMKRILLGKGIFYSACKQEHTKSIAAIFETSESNI